MEPTEKSPLNLRRILIWVASIVIILFLYSVWKIHRAENRLEKLFAKELAPTDSTAGLSISEVEISAWSGNIVFKDPKYFPLKDSLLLQASSFSINVGRWASLQLAVLPNSFVLNRLNYMQLSIDEVRMITHEPQDADAGSYLKMDVHGNPLQLYPIVFNRFMPSRNLRIVVTTENLSPDLSSIISSIFPEVISEQIKTSAWESLNAEVAFGADTGRLSIINAILQNREIQVRLNGSLYYDIYQSLYRPSRFESSLNIDISQNTGTEPVRFQMGAMGELGFEHVNWSISGAFPGDTLTFSVSELLENAEQSLTISRPSLFPAPGALGNNIEAMLVLFAVPTTRFDFRDFQSQFKIRENRAELTEIRLRHLAFEASMKGMLGPFKDPLSDSSIQGQMRLSNLSEELKNASLNIELIFGIPLKREENDVLLPVTGTLSSPRIQF